LLMTSVSLSLLGLSGCGFGLGGQWDRRNSGKIKQLQSGK